MEFEDTLQKALKTLKQSLEQHEKQKEGYERSINRLKELQRSVPPESKLPLGEIIGILRRTHPIQDFAVLLAQDLRRLLSPGQVIDIIRSAKTTLVAQIKDIESEILDAETTLSVLPSGTDVLNEEGLPIRDIREDVFDEQEGNRAVLSEEQPTKVYTMEEIDRMMDAAMEEEETELDSKESVNVQKTDESEREGHVRVEDVQKEELPEPPQKDKAESVQQVLEQNELVTKLTPDGLSVGYVNGEELIAKLVDDSKKRYNPMDDTWLEESDHEATDDYSEGDDDDDDDDEEEEEDQYGRTRGYLIPPNLSRPVSTNPPNPIVKEKAVKFASFEKPATPSSIPIDKPVKSALKKSNYTPQSSENTAVPTSSTSMSFVMTTDIVERNTKFNDTHKKDTKAKRKISLFKTARQGI